MPLLNTVFKSKFSESQIYDNLYSQLKQENLELENKFKGINIYVYTYEDEEISKNFLKFDSINNASKDIKITRGQIKTYLNINVPFKKNLFFYSGRPGLLNRYN